MPEPSDARKQRETFCWTLSIRRSCSAWLVSQGIVRSCRKASACVRASQCPDQRKQRTFSVSRGDAILWAYASMLHLLRKSAQTVTKQAMRVST